MQPLAVHGLLDEWDAYLLCKAGFLNLQTTGDRAIAIEIRLKQGRACEKNVYMVQRLLKQIPGTRDLRDPIQPGGRWLRSVSEYLLLGNERSSRRHPRLRGSRH